MAEPRFKREKQPLLFGERHCKNQVAKHLDMGGVKNGGHAIHLAYFSEGFLFISINDFILHGYGL